MFNFLKKKKSISKEDFIFLEAIVNKLAPKYDYLLNQISEDFILDKKENVISGKGTYVLILDSNLASKYSNKKFHKFFIIKGIKIFNIKSGLYESMELDIVEGILSGFKLNSSFNDLDINRIDVSGIHEKYFENKDLEELKKVLGVVPEKIVDLLDIENTFKIEIPEGSFYVIKDLEDGNYLSVDAQGAVYGMIHDPYEIEKLFDNKESFYKALESGQFSIDEYFDKKMS